MLAPSLNWTSTNLLDLEDTSILELDPVPTKVATIRDSRITKKEKLKWKRNIEVNPKVLKGNFLNNTGQQLNYQSAVAEARRCLKCADAPCQKSCPTSLDVRSFIGSIATGNIYGSAKQILSDNPIGLSCGLVCPTSELCVGSCNLAHLEGESGIEMGGAGGGKGAINIHGLQAYAVDSFRKMNIPQIRDPSLPSLDKLPASYSTKIALVGAGPSSISCATFLARLGYKDITIFEKSSFPGGLSSSEIPQTRLPYDAVAFETKLMLDLGVNIKYNVEFGKDITIPSLRESGYKAIYLAFGLPDPKIGKIFQGLSEKDGFFTSKSFLPLVTKASKKGMCACESSSVQLPKLYGKVVVLGAGDTAFDVASSAIRCGADRVVVTFRKGYSGIRAVPEEYEIVLREKADVLPNSLPKEIITRDGRIVGMELYQTDIVDGKDVIDEDQFTRIRCDFVISAFGSTVNSQSIIDGLLPVKINEYGIIPVDNEMRTNERDVFAGGDLSGNGLTVEAANDGKTASWYIHKYIQSELFGESVPVEPCLPKFCTPIDSVDLSVNVAGMKFKNPFGLASAPPATTCEMIARSFELGWGFAVTKTFSMDKDIVTNVAPRIIGGSTTGIKENAPNHSSYLNIELISEKSASYWCNGIRQLKKRYPDHIVIASIMSAFVKEDWQTLAIRCEQSGADAIELNLSCPHGMGERGMGLACGQNPDLVRDICKWVKEATKLPVFAKLTPNVTDITAIAAAAVEGGADGCTATNTVSGLMHLNRKGEAWPRIGEKMRTTYGGMSGNAIRPIALKAVSAIHKKFPNFPILATGGIDSAEAALQFIHAGASVCQVSSAVQNQNFAVIEDFITGLKTLLFMNGHSEYQSWESQLPPVDHRNRLAGKGLPKFGEYLKKRRELQAQDIAVNGILVYDDNFTLPNVIIDLSKVPSINESIGRAVKRITAWGELDPEAKEHVVAVVDEETCINCGLCYNICADTGYQAITFDKETHIPIITDSCTGCTLCFSCPVNAISMVPRTTVGREPYQSSRGIPLGEFNEPIRINV